MLTSLWKSQLYLEHYCIVEGGWPLMWVALCFQAGRGYGMANRGRGAVPSPRGGRGMVPRGGAMGGRMTRPPRAGQGFRGSARGANLAGESWAVTPLYLVPTPPTLKIMFHKCAISWWEIGQGKACDAYNSSIVEISQISEMKLDPLQVKESWMAGTRTRGTQRDGSRTPVLAGGTSLSHSSRWAHTVGPTAASTAGQAGTSNGTTTAIHSRGAEV